MKKKLNLSLIISISCTFVALIPAFICLVTAGSAGFSMGVETSEEAQYLNDFLHSGGDVGDLGKLMVEYEREHQLGDYAPGGYLYEGDNSASSSNPENASKSSEPAKEQPKQTISKPKTTPVPAKVYNHDYETITSEAKEAFISFTADGKSDSCYLNINASSTDNIITGKELNSTGTGKENGKISFVDGDKVKYEWLFSNWESADDFELDLTTKLIKIENGRYELVFSGNNIGNNNVIFRLRTGVSSTKIFVYDGISDKQSTITDNNGFLTLNLRTLGKYIISTSAVLTNEEVTNSLNSVEASGDASNDITEIPFSTPEDAEDVTDDDVLTSDSNTAKKTNTISKQNEEDIFVDPGYSSKTQNKNDASEEERVNTVKKTDSQAELMPEAVANNVLVIDDGPSLPNPLFIFIGLGVIVLAAGGGVIYRYKR